MATLPQPCLALEREDAAETQPGIDIDEGVLLEAARAGPTIETQEGQLVALALPRRSAGRVWRVARNVDAKVVQQVSEADVGSSVVLVFRATGKGTATVSFGLTRGETAKAYESRRFTVRVR